ncbi:MAG: hypothetical protein LBE76_00395 [Nitrososphaerota archaeon]|jgi:hypothetical protein|nr:hypothetical protein [Nitrososphaerota archaeon]
MPKADYNPEKIQKQKKLIGAIAVTLLIIVTIINVIYIKDWIIWLVLDLIIFGVAQLLLRRTRKTPL